MTHIDLFSGIGGFALAAEWVWPDIEHIFVDNDLFCQAILKKHWPNAQIYGDIRTLTNTRYQRQEKPEKQTVGSEQCDSAYILTGGFPCQPFSQAGRRQGTADDRYLWPEMFRVIREFKPRWVVAENVAGLTTWNDGMVLEQVCTDLEKEDYQVQPFVVPACAVNAPHRRDRVWIVANTKYDGQGREEQEGHGTSSGLSEKHRTQHSATREPKRTASDGEAEGHAQDPISQRGGRGLESDGQVLGRQITKTQDARPSWESHWFEVATKLCAVDDGLPNGLVRPRGWRNAALKAGGNAIVPQVAYEIMKAIKQSGL